MSTESTPLISENVRVAGDWLNQLKVILGQGAQGVGTRPRAEHRSTKAGVKLLLSNLRVGSAQNRNVEVGPEEIDRVVFNAVDLLMKDKEDKGSKPKLQALDKFSAELEAQLKTLPQEGPQISEHLKFAMRGAVQSLRMEALEGEFRAGRLTKEYMLGDAKGRELMASRPPALRRDVLGQFDPTALDDNTKAIWCDEMERNFEGGGVSAEDMLGTARGRLVLAAKPHMRGAVLSALNPANFDGLDLDGLFGADKNAVIEDALVSIAQKKPLPADAGPDRVAQLDPELFRKMAAKIPVEEWNNKAKGLGPRVGQGLWQNGNYDQIIEMIHSGVDTSIAARSNGKKGAGVYSGFFSPVQHIVSEFLRDSTLVDSPVNEERESVVPEYREKARGAKKIIQALEAKGGAKILTKYSEIKSSKLLEEFQKQPGTIWGFEKVRKPFVQAAHEATGGTQPLRMMELWEAVEKSLTAANYEKLLNDPAAAIPEFIAAGVKVIESGVKSDDPEMMVKYADIKRNKDVFIQKFKEDAKSCLTEFAAQMPKGTFARNYQDETGTIPKDYGRNPVTVATASGVLPNKMMGGLACKAGLWWAKKENKPVYYCLDGINMGDVINYKKVKNDAIQEFINSGGKTADDGGHDEVITMVEMREILKNWDELKGTVKLFDNGKILKDPELTEKMKGWQMKMAMANQRAGRTPAPDRSTFTFQLNAIDPGLSARIAPGKKGDMDARDIVKKFGCLEKVGRTRPQLVLKYMMSRCDVLVEYGLLTKRVVAASAEMFWAADDEVRAKRAVLMLEIQNCHVKLQTPLESMVRNSMVTT